MRQKVGENGEDVSFSAIGVAGPICGDLDIDKGGTC